MQSDWETDGETMVCYLREVWLCCRCLFGVQLFLSSLNK